MKLKTIILMTIGLALLSYFCMEYNAFIPGKNLTASDSLVAQSTVNFSAPTMQEEYISPQEFKNSSAITIPMENGEIVEKSVLGGSKIKTCVIGFIIKRADNTLYTLFLHVPGDKSATWNEKTFEYRYANHTLPVNFVHN